MAYSKSTIILCNLTEVSPLESHGLYNLGFTCYMNATLQCLFSVQTFYTDLLRQNSLLRRMPQSGLLRCFSALMSSKNQCRGEAKKLLQRRVKDAVSASAVMFSGYSEHDAQEFLNHCLVQLKEDGEKLVMAGEELQAGSPGISLSMYSCPVSTNMDFQLQYKMTCTGCGDFSVRQELFTMLSISVLPGCSIQDCLDHYFKVEDIERSCNKCSGNSSTLALKFRRLPRVLILHLKRFGFDPLQGVNRKLEEQVCIPSCLSLLPHCSHYTQPPCSLDYSAETALNPGNMHSCQLSEPLKENRPEKGIEEQELEEEEEELLRISVALSLQDLNHIDEDSTITSTVESEEGSSAAETGELCSSYRLISLVSHLGRQVSTGHYISDVYDFLTDKWLTYNDEKVSETDESAVQAERKCTGYIFFYMHKKAYEAVRQERTGLCMQPDCSS
ncbi:ubiquitin carboxyl-terminal hydrolase 37-like [Acipenser ruthenus]|uniref:ubiquitin carboxyl-terminal hydrolase 37-like n=1 Tax=Acipenser ruthenus TaxID=7906 RepID=UPI0027406393|nr:ubiquitin carboxyl-terminal hydrolase 37-like [Acipenser ruthenus]